MTISKEILPGVPLVESPLFEQSIDQLGLTDLERAAAVQLHERGYALIKFPDAEVEARIDRIKRRLGPSFGVDFDDPSAIKNEAGDLRIQDAWKSDEDVRQIAANEQVLDLLSKLYGRRAFPFQTLNFPVGTQQGLHSDSIHFSSFPERFMCGVWLAFEDVTPEAGPLVYVPGSHKWPILSNAMIGRRGSDNRGNSAQQPFEDAWRALVSASGIERERFLPKKGDALIWAANLLHGGDHQIDNTLTRWSQVTHYYFEDCVYYTPAYSDEHLGMLDLRQITNVATGEIEPNSWLGSPLPGASRNAQVGRKKSFWPRKQVAGRSGPEPLPSDFDGDLYLALHPDVAASGSDPADHYVKHGRHEGRRYRNI
jgi:hypothetical protein